MEQGPDVNRSLGVNRSPAFVPMCRGPVAQMLRGSDVNRRSGTERGPM